MTDQEITRRAILEIEAYTKGARLFKLECPSCGSQLDNHVSHAEKCKYLRADIVDSAKGQE